MMNWLRKLYARFLRWRIVTRKVVPAKHHAKQVEDSYEELPKVYSKKGKTKKMGFWCLCGLGRIMPRYRKGKSPTSRCNHCHVPYVPKMARG